MRRALTVILISLTLVALQIKAAEAEIDLQPVVNVQRDVEMINAGIIFMNDTFTFEAPSNASVTVAEFLVGFPSYFIEERHFFEIWHDDRWNPLSYRESIFGDENFRGFILQPSSPITLQGNSTLRIRASYLFVNAVSKVSGGYSAHIPFFPSMMYNISTFKIVVALPVDSSVVDVYSPYNFTHFVTNGYSTLEHESESIRPLRNETAIIVYAPYLEEEYLLDCENLKRHVFVKMSSLRAEDTYTLINRGDDINSFHLKLPTDASNINARDGVGPLKVKHEEAEEGADHIDAFITPRTALTKGDRWRLIVEYSLSKKERLYMEGGNPTLIYPLYGFPYYVHTLSAVVTLPEGASFIASDPNPSSMGKTGLVTEVVIDLGGQLPSEQPTIIVEFSQSLVWPIVRPLSGLIIAVGILGSIIILRRRRQVVEEKPAEAEKPGISEFLDLYVERISFLKEIEGLERDLEAKKIGRDRFNQRSAEINRRQSELTRSLKHLERTLDAEHPDIRNQLRQITRAEEELDRVNVDLRSLDVRLRTRRISRRDYRRRRKDYLGRRSRAMRRIEQSIASLRT